MPKAWCVASATCPRSTASTSPFVPLALDVAVLGGLTVVLLGTAVALFEREG